MAESALGLSDLVLVVRELQIDPARMDIKPLAQVLERHRRLLDVPAGKVVAPRWRPLGKQSTVPAYLRHLAH
jgi:hypothetical protein